MKDKFVNKAFITVTESAPNTLTFAELATGVSIFEKVAWVIHRLHWFVGSVVLKELITDTDTVTLGITGNNKMSTITLDDPGVYDMMALICTVSGTPANAFVHTTPIIRDFSTLPGGGIIVPPRPIYIAVIGSGLAAAAVASVRIEYTVMELKADEYWELVEATRILM